MTVMMFFLGIAAVESATVSRDLCWAYSTFTIYCKIDAEGKFPRNGRTESRFAL